MNKINAEIDYVTSYGMSSMSGSFILRIAIDKDVVTEKKKRDQPKDPKSQWGKRLGNLSYDMNLINILIANTDNEDGEVQWVDRWNLDNLNRLLKGFGYKAHLAKDLDIILTNQQKEC